MREALQRGAGGHPEIIFMGFVRQTYVPKYHSLADIFVLPSNEEETSPLTINEAMACGLPVILSDAIPSANEFVRDGENGLLFPVGDVEALRDRLNTLLADPALRMRMGAESLRKIQARSPRESAAGVIRAFLAITST